jgi:MoaA/NifB/PqqE/SkfB family radical SAM enzyme
MTHCPHPWTGLEIATDGTISPCCKFRADLFPNWPNFNVKDGIDHYRNSDALSELKQEFINGKQPAACVRCWKDEAANLPSKRQLDTERWSTQLDQSKIQFITLPMGNLCNLQCRICSPHQSSSLIKEWQAIYGEKISRQEWHKDPVIWNEIIEIAKGSLEIHIHGGEPFLLEQREHVVLLENLVASGAASNIRLHYSTNGTTWPSEDLWTAWKNFHWVDIQVSVDDCGERFEYNRYPAKWEKVKDNLLAFKATVSANNNLQLSISTTVSAYTIAYLDEFFDEISKLGLPEPWLGRLHTPQHYRIGSLPHDARQAIKEKLAGSANQTLQNASAWLDDDDGDWAEFVRLTKQHDQYRHADFAEIFPKLADLVSYEKKS